MRVLKATEIPKRASELVVLACNGFELKKPIYYSASAKLFIQAGPGPKVDLPADAKRWTYGP